MKKCFRIKDTSIRLRLVISNLIMFFMPFLLVILIAVFSFIGIFYRFDGNSLNAKLNDSLGFMTVYRIQLEVNDLENRIKKMPSGEELDEKALKMCEKLGDKGAVLSVVSGGDILYLTPGYTAEEFKSLAKKITGDNYMYNTGSLYTGPEGTYLTSVSENQSGEKVYVILCDTTLDNIVGGTNKNLPDVALDYLDTLMWILSVLAIIITLATDIILAVFISGSIIVPLEKLKTAAHEIRDGNLDYRIDYEAKNELGDVCADFEEMRHRLKESIEAQQRYETSWKELIAGISHDLRTPLTSIKGYVSGLIDGIASTPEKQERYLKTIYSTACDMENLINELFLFSKLESEKFPFNLEKVDLISYFADCYIELQPKFARNDMDLIIENKIGETAYASVDRLQLRRAVSNIAQNSIKYRNHEQHGTFKITISRSDNGILIELADNGTGVSERELEKIFESFYRSDKARTNVRSGSGLGLAITQSIIERHNGKVWAKGKIGEGLTVSFLLPEWEERDKTK